MLYKKTRMCDVGSGFGSVGRPVASNTRDTQFESRHRKTLFILSVNCIEKTKIHKKRPGIFHFKKD